MNGFDLGSVIAHVKADLTQFLSGMEQAKAAASDTASKAGNSMSNIKEGIGQAAAGVAILTTAFDLAAKSAIDVASNFEQTQTSFGTLLGSEQKAADLMKEIMLFEQHTPFDIQTLTNAAKGLLAFGVAQQDVVPHLKEFTDMSQGQVYKLQELVSIYGEVNSIQSLNGKEVLRLSSIGIPIYEAIADHFNKMGVAAKGGGAMTAAAVRDMISTHQITAQVFDQVLTEMTSKGGLFFNENIRQMSTFSGIMSSVSSQIQYALLNIMGIDLGAANEVRKGGLFDTLRSLAADLLAGLSKLQPVFKALGENPAFQGAMIGLAVAFGALSVIIPIVLFSLLPFSGTIAIVVGAIIALGAAWGANFLGIRDITAAVGGVVVQIAQQIVTFYTNTVRPFLAQVVQWWKDNGGQVTATVTSVFNILKNLFIIVFGFLFELVKEILTQIASFWQAHGAQIIAIVKGTFDVLVGIFQVITALIDTIVAAFLVLLTGRWGDFFYTLDRDSKVFFSGLQNIWNGFVSFLKGIGGAILDAILAPFTQAQQRISSIMASIKSSLDFTQRHSPSVIDIIENGVDMANQAFGKLLFNNGISQNVSQAFTNPITNMQNAINVDMSGAYISDTNTAAQLGGVVGDAIIAKLKQNVRF